MPHRTAFVFTGGASLGALHVGMLKALWEAGVQADLVVGASAGSVNAVGYAAGPDDEETLEFLENAWKDIRRSDLIQWEPMLLMGLLARRRNYLFDVEHLRELMTRHAPVQRLEDTAIPCFLVATEVRSGRDVVLSRGLALEAVLASMAIPSIWPPVRINGRLLMDGGVGAHAPITQAVEQGATRIVLLSSGYAGMLDKVPETPMEMLVHALLIGQVRQLVAELDTYDGRVPIHVVPPPYPIDVQAFDFSQTSRLIALARASAAAWLEAGGLSSTRLPASLARVRSP